MYHRRARPRSPANRHCLTLIAALAAAGCGSDGGSTELDAAADGGADAAEAVADTAPEPAFDLAPDLAPDLPPPPLVDIRADHNRDGVVDLTDPTEDADEQTWDESHGAIFLANLDDDDLSCPKVNSSISDADLAACHDAADEAIDGAADLEDLARLKTAPWPGAPDGATGRVELSLPSGDARLAPDDVARLFVDDGGGKFSPLAADHQLDADALRRGVTLALEGKDILRGDKPWDGYLEVTFTVRGPGAGGGQGAAGEIVGSDTVRLRLAPLLTSHHLQPAERIFVSDSGGPDSDVFQAGIAKALQAAGLAASALVKLPTWDQWTQDFFETGWMSMPAAGGKQHVITVLLRSANIEEPDDPSPLRWAGRMVFEQRGKDVAAIQQFDLKHDLSMQSLNSLGNLETNPPYDHAGQSYPLGRKMMGRTPGYFPDPSFTKLLEAQAVQPPVYLDTSWLLVGHVDETISFVPAASPRGWALVRNDPALAKLLLEEASAAGHGATKMFEGQQWLDYNDNVSSATVTIDEVLADTEVMAESAKAVVEVEAQLVVLKQETGITAAEMIPLPFLHYPVDGFSVAYQPGTVNSTLIAPGHFLAPETHGPLIDGVDPFKQQLQEALAKHQVTVHYVENWDLYHRLSGEVHCGTNSLRALPAARWWQSGR